MIAVDANAVVALLVDESELGSHAAVGRDREVALTPTERRTVGALQHGPTERAVEGNRERTRPL